MKYGVSFKGVKPAYLQLYEELRADIVRGAYPFLSKLPSKRIMAEETGLSVITVRHAYELLSDEGYVEPRERSGYFVAYRESDFGSRGFADGASAEFTFKDATPKAGGEGGNRKFPFTVLAKTMRKVLSDYGENIFEKCPNKGCLPFRKAVCDYLERSVGIRADVGQVIVGAGAEYLYGLVVQMLGKDKIFALENPSYKKIKLVYGAHGVKTEFLDLGENGIKTECLANSFADVLHVTPFNSYPGHVTADASKRKEYLNWAEARGGYIIEDNYDSELTVSKKNEETLFSYGGGRVIYMNTFSHTLSPSVRVGYMVIPEQLFAVYESEIGFYSCPVPLFDQLVLAELLNSGEFEHHINRVRRDKRKRLNLGI